MKALYQRIRQMVTRATGSSGQSLRSMCHGMVYGFTLLELVIAMGVSSIGITGSFVLYRSGLQLLDVTQATGETNQSIRKGFETMILEIQETSVDTIDTSIPHAISFASARQSDVFQIESDGTPIWQNTVVYFLDPGTGTLCRYVTAKSNWATKFNTVSVFEVENPQQLVPDVSDLTFTLNGNLLAIGMQISKSVRSADSSDPLTTELATQVYLRN